MIKKDWNIFEINQLIIQSKDLQTISEMVSGLAWLGLKGSKFKKCIVV